MIKLKSIKIADHLSEETLAFSATVYFNGKKIGYAKNSGRGGCTDVYTTNPQDYRDLEEYVKTLPDTEFEGTKIKPQLEFVIDDLVYEFHNNKANLKQELLVKKAHVKNIQRGLKTLKLVYSNGSTVGCVGIDPKVNVTDKFVQDYAKHQKINVTSWQLLG